MRRLSCLVVLVCLALSLALFQVQAVQIRATNYRTNVAVVHGRQPEGEEASPALSSGESPALQSSDSPSIGSTAPLSSSFTSTDSPVPIESLSQNVNPNADANPSLIGSDGKQATFIADADNAGAAENVALARYDKKNPLGFKGDKGLPEFSTNSAQAESGGAIAQSNAEKRSVHTYRNKRGGKMTIVSNKNRLFRKAWLPPKLDRFAAAEESRKQAKEEKTKQEEQDQAASKNEEAEKEKRKTKALKQREYLIKQQKDEQMNKLNRGVLRSDLQVFSPKKGYVFVENRWIEPSYRFTWAFWVRVKDRVSYWGAILTKGNNDGIGQRSPGVWLYPGTLRLHIRSTTASNGNDGANPDPTQSLTMNLWTHVAFSHQENELNVYINGKLVHTNKQIGQPKLNEGAVWCSYGDPAAVDLADVRYYPRILSIKEVRQIHEMAKYENKVEKSYYSQQKSSSDDDLSLYG